MEEKYRVPLHIRLNRRLMRVFFRGLFHLLGKVELYGMDKIPHHNRYVLAFNHVSLVEIPFIGAFWPTIVEIIGATVVWGRPGVAIAARMWEGIQVKRTEFDREVFRKVKMVIDAGFPLMISPEGTRSHTPGLTRGKPGVAYIIDKAKVPVLPVAVVGNTIDFLRQGIRGKRPTIQMFVGDLINMPLLAGRGEERRDMRQQNTDIIMARIAEMLPESYRG
ncbi:MAG: 1-acyl-sn-glycerol-3-phosphate acyltransferase, partial [Anaerolineales bacterium]|nr:1-acyl-sn-glycerol-3-phosphate acyltransferase [Anaerolineales bacterium]